MDLIERVESYKVYLRSVKLWSLLVWLWQMVINPLHLSRDWR